MHLNDTIREMIYTAFADHEQHRKQKPISGIGHMTVSQESGSGQEQAASGSLCLSCAKRVTCSQPGRSGGVWHCEEYF